MLTIFLRMQQQASFHKVNEELESLTGIRQCFKGEEEWLQFRSALDSGEEVKTERDRAEFGDFQTPPALAEKITKLVSRNGSLPGILVEPTCGKGHFIIAAIRTFPCIREVHGLDIHQPYLWQTKFSLIDLYLGQPDLNKPAIYLHHGNVFDFNFETLVLNDQQPLLIIGNPPWVTNAMLGSMASSNLPEKSNFKQQDGIAAVTGKGNFDIAENITLMLLKAFHGFSGQMTLLVKNSVIRNILLEQYRLRFSIGEMRQYQINSLKEFEVKAEASLFSCKLNSEADFTCTQRSFYRPEETGLAFGWVEEKFVSNTDSYIQHRYIEGKSPLEWRQGLKHDCSLVMELEKTGQDYRNALQQTIRLEDELVFGLLKSSDLQQDLVDSVRKFTIVTQHRPGADTDFIRQYPATWDYLQQHRQLFLNRRSSIYKNKPAFSIFGIGDYSFKPYKVAISGLYKSFRFALVLPQNGKPLMLDDTCYMLGFDEPDYAVYTWVLLNSAVAKDFLASITFSDAKRTFTKEALMRIDLQALAKHLPEMQLQEEIEKLNNRYGQSITVQRWAAYCRWLATGS
ncbi:hypothetical protein [Pseudobacter ginsenosidimutans]|uniref:hypothetical protein n=1 Tax=Pseudobacter ginsenosidimutans TaxID=661488 RepID=UPI00102DF13C|nr:hypothetical protein [Pseudobacter ginsenosidimutans]QEC40643.1 hypothetical protein FSB84_02625 [Pseudobacter ginsenosidimutans]